jgi:hypothetical protein
MKHVILLRNYIALIRPQRLVGKKDDKTILWFRTARSLVRSAQKISYPHQIGRRSKLLQRRTRGRPTRAIALPAPSGMKGRHSDSGIVSPHDAKCALSSGRLESALTESQPARSRRRKRWSRRRGLLSLRNRHRHARQGPAEGWAHLRPTTSSNSPASPAGPCAPPASKAGEPMHKTT